MKNYYPKLIKNKDGSYKFRMASGYSSMDFEYAEEFEEDRMAIVKIFGKYSLMNEGFSIDSTKFDKIDPLVDGLRLATIGNKQYYIDSESNTFSREDGRALCEIYRKPERFLDLPPEKFRGGPFLECALGQVKRGLIHAVKNKEFVNDDYVAYCGEVLESCKKEVVRQQALLEKSDKNRSDLIGKINNFHL